MQNYQPKKKLTSWYQAILYGLGLERIWHSKYTSSFSFMSSGFREEPIFNVTTGTSIDKKNEKYKNEKFFLYMHTLLQTTYHITW